MRIAIYARCSTDTRNLVPIEVQNDNNRAFIAKQGWTEVAAYSDPATTGFAIEPHPGMKALRDAAQRGEIDLVLATDLDRFSRSQTQITMMCESLASLDVRLTTIAQGAILQNDAGCVRRYNARQTTGSDLG